MACNLAIETRTSYLYKVKEGDSKAKLCEITQIFIRSIFTVFSYNSFSLHSSIALLHVRTSIFNNISSLLGRKIKLLFSLLLSSSTSLLLSLCIHDKHFTFFQCKFIHFQLELVVQFKVICLATH